MASETATEIKPSISPANLAKFLTGIANNSFLSCSVIGFAPLALPQFIIPMVSKLLNTGSLFISLPRVRSRQA
jgi:hypothetical protein